MINCSICDTQCKDRKGFSSHTSRMHKFDNDAQKEKYIVYTIYGKESVDNTTLAYINEEYCIQNLPIDIGKYLQLMGLKRTSKEERKTNRYKNKYINSIRIKYNDNNITNISQVKEVQNKKIQKNEENNGS